MAVAGLPQGVIFDNGGAINRQKYVQFSGGSNAQSSIIQFFDIVLGVEHRSTGEKKSETTTTDLPKSKPSAPPSTNFILEMRKYMPGPHARFLRDVDRVANIRTFVEERASDRGLTLAYDACLAMLRSFRDTHIQIVSRYIIIKSREAASAKQEAATAVKKVDLAHRSKPVTGENIKKDLKGTGGTALIPFLRQARDETGEPAVDEWTRRLLSKKGVLEKPAAVPENAAARPPLSGSESLKSVEKLWQADGNGGGLCTF
jgi:indoleamine 2,3-dioxygenase